MQTLPYLPLSSGKKRNKNKNKKNKDKDERFSLSLIALCKGCGTKAMQKKKWGKKKLGGVEMFSQKAKKEVMMM